MNETELRSIRDRLDIAEVMTRYATGIDNVSLDILRGCFADEVEIQASSAGKLHELFQHAGFDHGIKLKRDDWVNNLGAGMRSNGVTVTQHVITNHFDRAGSGRGGLHVLPARDALQRYAVPRKSALRSRRILSQYVGEDARGMEDPQVDAHLHLGDRRRPRAVGVSDALTRGAARVRKSGFKQRAGHIDPATDLSISP